MMIGYSVNGWWESYIFLLFFVGYPLMLIVAVGLAIADVGRWATGRDRNGRIDVSALAIVVTTGVAAGWALAGREVLTTVLGVVAVIEFWTVLAVALDRHPTAFDAAARRNVAALRLVPALAFASFISLPWILAFAAIGTVVGSIAGRTMDLSGPRTFAVSVSGAVVAGLVQKFSMALHALDFSPEPMWAALTGALAALAFDLAPRRAAAGSADDGIPTPRSSRNAGIGEADPSQLGRR